MAIETEAFQFSEFGAPEVLAFKAETLADPAPGEIQIRHLAIGVNYIDIYHRRGTAPLPLPSGLGVEGVGVVTALGEEVVGLLSTNVSPMSAVRPVPMPPTATCPPHGRWRCPTRSTALRSQHSSSRG